MKNKLLLLLIFSSCIFFINDNLISNKNISSPKKWHRKKRGKKIITPQRKKLSRFIDKEKKIKLLRLDKKRMKNNIFDCYDEEVTNILNSEDNYEKQLKYLESLINDSSNENEMKKRYSIYILGEFGCEEKLDLLYDNIDYEYKVDEDTWCLPVIHSLENFGLKILPDLIDIIRNSDQRYKVYRAFNTICLVDEDFNNDYKNIRKHLRKKKKYKMTQKNQEIYKMYKMKVKLLNENEKKKTEEIIFKDLK